MATIEVARISTGLAFLDRLLGGGLPRQSLVVVAGLPGSGKSILAFHIMAEAVRKGATTMLVATTHQPLSRLRVQYGNLSFMSHTAVLDEMEFLELDTGIEEQTLLKLLNTIVLQIEERRVGVAVVDSFRAISDLAESPSQVWRFLGALSAQLVEHDCICLLVGEYSLPRDLDRPELAMADVVIYLEVEHQAMSEVRTLQVYKVRGGPYLVGRHAFYVTDDGIQFAVRGRADLHSLQKSSPLIPDEERQSRKELSERILARRAQLPPLEMTTAELVRLARQGLESYDAS